jgi:hypothetical protein
VSLLVLAPLAGSDRHLDRRVLDATPQVESLSPIDAMIVFALGSIVVSALAVS